MNSKEYGCLMEIIPIVVKNITKTRLLSINSSLMEELVKICVGREPQVSPARRVVLSMSLRSVQK